MFQPAQHDTRRSRLSRLARGAITLAAVMGLTAKAYATVIVYNWVESNPDPALHGMADITLGAPLNLTATTFSIASFAIFQNGGFCGVCTPQTEDLSLVTFDALTSGVVGQVTGSFLGQGGGLHTFKLTTADLPGGLWTFVDTKPNKSKTSTGTYTTTVKSVDEPSALLWLVGAGIGFLMALARRHRA